MHIVINCLSVHSGGGLTSWLSLLPAMHSLRPDVTLTVLVTQRNIGLFERLPESIRRSVVHGVSERVSVRKALEQIILPFVLLRLKADWLFGLANTVILAAPCRVVLNLENANPYSALPIAWSRHWRMRLGVVRFLGGLSVRRATLVRFLSENSRARVCARLGLPLEKTVVIPHGVEVNSGPRRPQQAAAVPAKPFLLTVANLFPHKNVHTLLEAFAILVRDHGYRGSLVVVGSSFDAAYTDSLHARVASAGLADRVHFVGWIDPADLPALYEASDCLVFPSAEETFGMPVLEAMATGTPVVAPSLKQTGEQCFIPYEEICGEHAAYCNAFDAADMAHAIQTVVSDPARRDLLVSGGRERARLFSWDRVAREMLTALEERTKLVHGCNGVC